MKIVNWLTYENQRDAYIMDGLPEWKAKIFAKRDCKKNPYESKVKQILNKELEEAAKLEGSTYRTAEQGLFKIKESFKRDMLNFINGPVGYLLFVLFIFTIALQISTLFNGVIVYFIWNKLIALFFNINALTFTQSLIVGFVLALLFSFSRKRATTD